MKAKQYYSFMYRIEQIENQIKQFSSGQKYIDQKCLTQLENINQTILYGKSIPVKCWSVHDMVQIKRINNTKKKLIEAYII